MNYDLPAPPRGWRWFVKSQKVYPSFSRGGGPTERYSYDAPKIGLYCEALDEEHSQFVNISEKKEFDKTIADLVHRVTWSNMKFTEERTFLNEEEQL